MKKYPFVYAKDATQHIDLFSEREKYYNNIDINNYHIKNAFSGIILQI